MNDLLNPAVANMLAAFGVRNSIERVEAFTEAVDDAQQCERCAVRAAKNITANFKRPPFPVHLVEETREAMGTAEHANHVRDSRALSVGDLGAWWATEAPVLVGKAWPELTGEQRVKVAKLLESFGYCEPTWSSVAAELGFVDEHGPTPEREWWLKNYPELVPSGEDPRYA